MTIKEVEELLGIDRETVRFYIRKGLLSPKQIAKNYRIYSEEDVARLKRILILRQMEVSIADIGRILSGETDLQSVLAGSKELIRQKQRIVNDAADICDKLMKDGSDASFDPDLYFINYPKLFAGDEQQG